MGTLQNLVIGLKTSFGRPLSRADIYAYCEGFIKAPPVISPEWKPIFNRTFFRVEGLLYTLADYYREHLLKPSLDKIAAAPTRTMQHSECIREAMSYDVWRNLNVCLNAAKTEVGRAMVDERLKRLFPELDTKQRALQATAWSVMAITVQSCLVTLGTNLLGLDKTTELQMGLCLEYDREIMMMDVKVMDLIWQNHADEPDVAYELAGWKDEYINPIVNRMNHLLEATKNKVIYGTFNLAEFQTAAKVLQEEWEKTVPQNMPTATTAQISY
jgi:hypothetical protein